MAVAAKYNIPVVEDAAEALGSHTNGKMCGTFGIMSVLSFNGNKIITTSGGGALVAYDKDLIAKCRFLSTQARDAAPHYEHSQIGYNYRMSNICAGIGRGQMEVLNKRIEQRRAVYNWYKEQFKDIKGVSFAEELNGDFCNRWLTAILIDPTSTNGITRETLRLALDAENIESRPLWKPMHLQPIFKDCPYYGEGVSDKLFQNGLCLPSGSNLTEEELQRISAVIKTVFSLQV